MHRRICLVVLGSVLGWPARGEDRPDLRVQNGSTTAGGSAHSAIKADVYTCNYQQTADISLKPGAITSWAFDDLPVSLASLAKSEKTPARLTFRLPDDYSPDRTFPVFVYLIGGPGGRGEERDLALGLSVAGTKGFIVVTMPLFKRKLDPEEPAGGLMVSMDDFATASAAYRVMLERFFAAVPNTDPERSVFGGHSNGAHTAGVLLAGQDELILARFGAFFLHEGGVGPLFANVLQKRSFRGKRFLVMTAGGTPRSPAPLGSLASLLKAATGRGRLDFTFVTMDGYGHDQPPEYLRVVGQWTRRETLDVVLARRQRFAERLSLPLTGHPDASEWPDMVNADLSNTRHKGGKWTEPGVLSVGSDLLETKSDFDNLAIDLEFVGNAGLHLGDAGRVTIGENPADAKSLRPAGEWNRLTAVRREGHLVVLLNGAAVRDQMTPAGRVRAGLASGEGVKYRAIKLVPLP